MHVTAKPLESRLCTSSCGTCSGISRCLCGGLNGVLRQRLDRVRQPRTVERGETLFDIGSRFRSLYAVRSGSIKVHTLDVEGEEQVLGFYLPGEVLGLEAIDRGWHDSIAVALETSGICEIGFDVLERLGGEQPAVQQRMNRIYAHEIARDHAMLRLLARKSAEQRLAMFLVNFSERLAARGFSADEFNLSMSRNDIGNYLGLALETVSRLLARFQQQGLIQVNRRYVRLLGQDALRALSGIHMIGARRDQVH